MANLEPTLAKEVSLSRAGRAHAENGAPEREPEVWNASVAAFNPHLLDTPEPPPVAVSPEFLSEHFNVEQYLAEERSKDLLRFSTAGSVDDGKSTLIGRLLYDTQSVYDDQLQSIEGKGTTAPGVLDLALLTDGLRAEREQGITIDVAYRYFSTARRKFIIADTPGHEQYTRNMATGASTADVAIILIDARKGVLTQSRRHAYITALLGVRNIVVAINKMDLMEYAESVFERITVEFTTYFRAQDVATAEATQLHFVPVSALAGDNVVHSSSAMPWYTGSTLLALLETLPSAQLAPEAPFRLGVQRVVRPDLDFRGYAGQVASGTVHCGDSITVLPSGKQSRVKKIVTYDGELSSASAPLSITLTLEDEVDVSRGDVLATNVNLPIVATQLDASLVWMDSTALDVSRRYVLKHMSRSVQAFVRQVRSIVDLSAGKTAEPVSPLSLALNEIGYVRVEVLQALAVDAYADNRHTGSFVLIDPVSNQTVAAGMVLSTASDALGTRKLSSAPVSVEDKRARYHHIGIRIEVSGSVELLDILERLLFVRGGFVVRLGAAEEAASKVLADAGALVLTHRNGAERRVRARTLENDFDFELSSSTDVAAAAASVLDELRVKGVLLEGFPL